MFFGAVVWDPWLIIAQIVCLQCLYYLTLGVSLSVLVGTRVSRMSLVYFFDFATVTASTVTGCCVIASFAFSSVAGAGYMLYLIERAKKCLDFSATLFIIHLLICITYGGWPASVTWWVVSGMGMAVMALLGKYLCRRCELKEIPITRSSRQGFSAVNDRALLGCNQMTYNTMDIQIHNLEQEAYCAVLRAFKAQSDALTWDKESLITELRKGL